jgi:hypothetical protein
MTTPKARGLTSLDFRHMVTSHEDRCDGLQFTELVRNISTFDVSMDQPYAFEFTNTHHETYWLVLDGFFWVDRVFFVRMALENFCRKNGIPPINFRARPTRPLYRVVAQGATKLELESLVDGKRLSVPLSKTRKYEPQLDGSTV